MLEALEVVGDSRETSLGDVSQVLEMIRPILMLNLIS